MVDIGNSVYIVIGVFNMADKGVSIVECVKFIEF